MLKKSLLALTIAATLGTLAGCDSNDDESTVSNETTDLLQYVNPFIGTGGSGHTFPGAVAPQGMVQLSPDTTLTGWDSASGYHDNGKRKKNIPVYGFSHTHLSGTGVTDLGDILVLPYSDGEQSEQATFDKSNESASAGYYQVTFNESDIKAELTTSKRVGFHRYTFPEGRPRNIKLDLGHTLDPERNGSITNEIEIIDEYTIRGRRLSGDWVKNQDIYFYAKFSAPIKDSRILASTSEFEAPEGKIEGQYIQSYLEFEPGTEPLEVKLAISPVSTEGAQKNLEAEVPDWDFTAVKTQTENEWREELSAIDIQGGSEVEKTNFYTAMYHSQMAPMIYQDVDGQYRAMYGGEEQRIETAEEDLPNYSIYSMWDTFRAVHPLQTIIYPERAEQYANDLIRKQQHGGLLPKWEAHSSYTGTMIGYPAVIIIADAINKGLDVDPNAALEAALTSTNYHPEDFEQQWGDILGSVMPGQMEYYEDYGFVGTPNWNSVSYTLEFAIGDGSVAQTAQAAGRTEIADRYLERSKSYKAHWKDGFFQPREQFEGEFLPEFDPYTVDHYWYTEGNAWQWKWSAMHDIDGLIELIGGPTELGNDLDELFTADEGEDGGDLQDMTGFIGQYVHGNEPSHHVAYLYSLSDTPWKSQKYLDQIMDEFYTNESNGLIGNEDVGQMSAWYILSAMGFYQINPSDPTYTIGRPLFDKVSIDVEGGEFTIIAENNGPDNKYVQEVTINGEPLDENLTFQHKDIKAGGELRFVMGSTPNKEL
ncbi:GH92 family glycosyl hydrolase [Endozoicomonas arenosclerae]|uniref:GH92 family glycosyl hydrolase n=1 Tax=Endozoicomonas arenosclerae TaxID=1633495 RepID=UPI0007815D70|nr:GH92 family glycosyl hydrolase [Endozoicomonas arenosclerae]